MKKHCTIWLLAMKMIAAAAQEPTGLPSIIEQQLEDQAERQETQTEDDSYWQQLQFRQKHPLNLNAADETDLNELSLLSELQISNFFRYRTLLGPLVTLYELQAIPGWDLQTIRRLLPFVTVSDQIAALENVGRRFKNGEQKLLTRLGWRTDTSTCIGSPLAVLARYTYRYKNLLQYGITGEKDAGEKFPDFYSFHFFARKLGGIKALALGDFTVRLGQGLIQWQGLSFKKSSNVTNIKKQSPVLQPYNASGEFNFYRGAGITIQKKQFELTLFGSVRKFSAHLKGDSITSLITSGYHRSLAELAGRNNIRCISTGGRLQWHNAKAHIGINTVQHYFSKPFQPADAPYDLFATSGSLYSNQSIDYGYTVRNLHVFGEVAVDKDLHTAQLHGLLAGIDPKCDLSVLYRAIGSKYQSLFSNAFTENTSPVNEKGLYAGITIRPVYGFQIDVFADVFAFPWLKYQVDAPSHGHEYMLQLTCTTNRNVELYTRLRQETKPVKDSGTGMAIVPLTAASRKNWRTQITFTPNRQVLLRSRVEAVWYGKKFQSFSSTGFLFFQELHWKPAFAHWSLNGRVQYVETGDYNARIYAMENLVLYNYSMPAFFNKGLRCIININYRFRNRVPDRQINCQAALAFAQTVYPSKTAIGPADDAIDGQKRTEIKLQMIVSKR